MNQQVTWKMFLKMMLTIAFPIAMQNLLTNTASMVDTIMIGNQGELSVAAVGICSQISILFFAQYWGARDEEGINRTFGLTFICMAIVGFGFGLMSILHPSFLLSIYTDKVSLIEIGAPYMRIVGFAYPLQVFAVLVSVLMRSTERVKAPLVCSAVALGVNCSVNWVLIYGRFGFPEMGAAGAAVGTLLSAIVNLTLLIFALLRSGCEVRLRLSQIFAIKKSFTGEYLKKVLPILGNELLYGVGQMLINIVIGHQNEAAIAAMAAFRVCEGFVYAFFGGLSNANSVVVGREVGAGRLHRGYQFAKRSAVFCPLITFTIVLICVLLNHPLFTLFGLGSQAMAYGTWMLLIYLFFGAVRTCDYIINDTFRAGGEPVVGTVIEISCLFLITVPLTWAAGMVWHLPFLAVFAFVYTDELIRLFILVPYLRSGKWVKPVTDDGKAALAEFRETRKNRGRKRKRRLIK